MGSWIIGVVLVIATLLGTIAATRSDDLKEQQQQGQSEAVVGSMMVYRNKVTAYAQANPTFTGEVENSALALPSWFTPIAGVRNFVAGGQGFVYFAGTGAESGQAYLMLKSADNDINVGIKRGSTLYNPIAGTTLVAMPAAIPDDAVVFAPLSVTTSAVTPPGPPPAADCVVPGGTGRTWNVGGITCAGSTGSTVSVTSGYTLAFTSSNGKTGAADFLCTDGTLAAAPSTATCTEPPVPCTLPSPSTETATETRTGYQTIGCPAGYVGQKDQSRPEERSRSRTAYCPAATGPYAWGAWSAYTAWTGTGGWTTYNDTCALACTLPSPSTETQTQWVAMSGSCPVGQIGTITWEKQQSRQRTAYCPAATGPYSWGSWTAWSDTGSTRYYSNTCGDPPPPCTLPSPSTETQTETRTGYQTIGCPAGYTGWKDQSRPEQRSRSRTAYCPAATGPYAWGAWSAYTAWSATGGWTTYNDTCTPSCSAPGPSSSAVTRAVANENRTVACPAGQTGSIGETRTRSENGTQTTSWTCPGPTSSTSTTWHGTYNYGAWTTTSNTCVAAGPVSAGCWMDGMGWSYVSSWNASSCVYSDECQWVIDTTGSYYANANDPSFWTAIPAMARSQCM